MNRLGEEKDLSKFCILLYLIPSIRPSDGQIFSIPRPNRIKMDESD